jgi:ribosomal protein L44E
MKKLKTQENNSKLKQKTQGFGKFPIFVFLNPTKIDSKTAEISVKCQICIQKFKIYL